jgi:hypothetical protein
MAERRIGEGEEFKRMLERVVVAAQPEVAAVESTDSLKPRLQLSTAWFLKNMRKKAEGSATTAKEDANAFRQRWVNGAGMPALRGAYHYDARGGQLQIALRQGGSVQCLKAALKSKVKAEGLKVGRGGSGRVLSWGWGGVSHPSWLAANRGWVAPECAQAT